MSKKKDISTFGEDIYKIFDNPVEINEEYLDAFLEEVKVGLIRQISEKRKDEFYLRMSNIGWRPRKLWYESRSTAKDTLHGSHKIKFIFGDFIEALLKLLGRIAGHEITDEQKELVLNGIKGHIDGRVDGVLTDFKSASPFGFQKFLNDKILTEVGGFGEVYLHQLGGYMEAEGDEEAAFIALDKVSGKIAVQVLDEMDFPVVGEQINKLKVVIESDKVPEKCYSDEPDGKSGNMKLSSGCSWCAFKHKCWSDANGGQGLRTFKYSNQVRYLTNVAKAPKVLEIFPRKDEFEDEI